MVDKSTKILLMFAILVLMLSLKDLVLIQTSSNGEKATTSQPRSDGGIHLKSDDSEEPTEPNESFNTDDDSESTANSDYNEFDMPNDSPSSDDEPTPQSASHQFAKTIPSLKMKSNIQTLKFMFCYSCGYRNAFEQYAQIVQSRFPELKIVGENYPPAGYKLYLTQFISTFKIIVIGCIMFGFNPFAQFNMPTPTVFTWATQNKFYASIMLFFISNSIETHLISTGAFEIYLNDMQIWSKLASDRMPHEKELLQILDMNFNFESSEKAAAFGGSTNGKF